MNCLRIDGCCSMFKVMGKQSRGDNLDSRIKTKMLHSTFSTSDMVAPLCLDYIFRFVSTLVCFVVIESWVNDTITLSPAFNTSYPLCCPSLLSTHASCSLLLPFLSGIWPPAVWRVPIFPITFINHTYWARAKIRAWTQVSFITAKSLSSH